MIAFFTQYYRGMGHSNRTKLIAEKTAETSDVIIIDQLFRPPLDFKVKNYALMDDIELPEEKRQTMNLSSFIMNERNTQIRVQKFKKIIDENKVKLLVCEGFPFCRHQFAYEYFTYFNECRKRGIKIIVSARDFPWDDPHDDQLKDWVNYTQNIVCNVYAEKILIHGDENILPLYSDRVKHGSPTEVIDEIKDKIIYTGYVADNTQKPHERKNNIVYVSTGLNKEEGLLLFKEITKIAPLFPDLRFVMPVANRYLKTSSMTRDNMIFVDYIPNLNKKIQSCAAYITYGGYNATMEILASQVPAIIIPRQNGHKLEQFVRAYKFEPYGYFKVVNVKEIHHLPNVLKKVLKSTPNKFEYNLNGVERSADEINEVYKKSC